MVTSIRLARAGDIPALTELWVRCFHDPEAYVRYFYRENFDRIAIPVYTVDDRPVGMLHLLDATFADGGEERPAKLIYAAGTAPALRRNGYMGALLEHVTADAARKGYALFMKPATARLQTYYESFGFAQDACFRLVTLSPGEETPLPAAPLAPETYNRLRNEAFSGRPYVRWPDRHLAWCVAENAYCGGETLSVRLDDREHFLMCAPRGNALLIYETDLTLSQLKRLSGALCARFGTEILQAYLPDFSCGEGEEIISSVLYNAPRRNTYVNLILF